MNIFPMSVDRFPVKKMDFDPAFLAVLDEPWDTVVFGLDYIKSFGDILEGSAGYVYGRVGRCHPWLWVLESMLAKLYNVKHCLIYPSGMKAITAVIGYIEEECKNTLPHFSLVNPVYGCTAQHFERRKNSGFIDYSYADGLDYENISLSLRHDTVACLLEPWANPTLSNLPINVLREILRTSFQRLEEREIKSIPDDTFSAYKHIRPLELGCWALVVSLTKFINDFGDELAGAVLSNDGNLMEGLCKIRGDEGPILNHNSAKRIARRIIGLPPGHHDMDLAVSSLPERVVKIFKERGLPSLDDRLNFHTLNARKFVTLLKRYDVVENVIYPGAGGMVSFQLRGGVDRAESFVNTISKNSPLLAPERSVPFENIVKSNQAIINSVSLGVFHKPALLTVCSRTTHKKAFEAGKVKFAANIIRGSIGGMFFNLLEEVIHTQLQTLLKQS